MEIQYLGANIFYREVEEDGVVWVAKNQHQFVHTLDLDREGFSLPVWSQRARVETYLENARLVGAPYEPFAVPVDAFTNSWLPDKSRGIWELLINMDGLSKRALVLTVEEFMASRTRVG